MPSFRHHRLKKNPLLSSFRCNENSTMASQSRQRLQKLLYRHEQEMGNLCMKMRYEFEFEHTHIPHSFKKKSDSTFLAPGGDNSIQSNGSAVRSVAEKKKKRTHYACAKFLHRFVEILIWLSSVCWLRLVFFTLSYSSLSLCCARDMTEIMNDFLVRKKFLILLKIWLKKNTRRIMRQVGVRYTWCQPCKD